MMNNSSMHGSPVAGSRSGKGASSQWLEWTQQLQAYVAWVNSQLKKRTGCRLVEDLRHDMQDGVALVHLIEIVSGETLARVDYNPQTSTAMRENVERVLQFMASKRIRMHHTSAKDIVDGNLKAIMRLILALAAHYKPSSVKQTPQTPQGTPHHKPQRQQSFAAMAAGAAAAIRDARKDVQMAGGSLRRSKGREQAARLHGHSGLHRSSPVSMEKDPLQRCRSPRGSPAPSASNTPLHSRTATPVRALLESRNSPLPSRTASFASDHSDQGSEYGNLSRRTSIAWSDIDDDHEAMKVDVEDTKKMLLSLQEMLLSGKVADEEGVGSDAEEDQFDGTAYKDYVVVLQARLDQRQAELKSTKMELSEMKQECRNLQGAKAGVQSRLTDQDNALLQMKAELLRVGFTQQNLESENADLKRQLEEKNRIANDVTKQLQLKDKFLQQQQEQIEMLTQQLQELNSLRTELQNQLEEGGGGLQEFHSQIQQLSDRLEETSLSMHITSQDNKLCSIESRFGLKDQSSYRESTEEMQTLRSALRNLRSSMSSHDPHHHSLDTLEQGVTSMMERIQAGIVSSRNSDTSSTESARHSSPRRILHEGRSSPSINSIDVHCTSNGGPPVAQSTKVLYFTERTVTPFMSSIPKKLGQVTLRDFKKIFDRDGPYRYHFKALDPEFGTVKEEVVDDDDIIPGWEGKIVGWVEEDVG
ncbi:dixin-like isoform X2 [Anneissia japonica]|uniref:dixin-like isoform X2 n=1 Tax=Anneissia japonica TaxID=1529436 RepID=UPI0014255E3D|nr:dixin-like isoform X2 [Anneissia japonica]